MQLLEVISSFNWLRLRIALSVAADYMVRRHIYTALGSHINLQLAETPHCPLSGC